MNIKRMLLGWVLCCFFGGFIVDRWVFTLHSTGGNKPGAKQGNGGVYDQNWQEISQGWVPVFEAK